MNRFILLAALVAALTFLPGCHSPSSQSGASAGARVGGPVNTVTNAPANTVVFYNETFRAGVPAVVTIAGDGSTDLDIYVYDAAGQLIVYTSGAGDHARVEWTPPATASYRIEVHNHGNYQNRFRLTIN
jgi:hypothetical protein